MTNMPSRTNRLSIRGPQRSARGFTLLELLIVITIIVILATMGAVRYEQSLKTARYATQQHDISVLNAQIQHYTEDKEAPPNSLDDLVSAGYIGSIPIDPVTRQQDWQTVQCDELFSADQTSSQGICSVQPPDQGSGDQSSSAAQSDGESDGSD